jgi:Spy/CpxP family protein refolding chaperone
MNTLRTALVAAALAACSLATTAQPQPAERNTRHALIIGIGKKKGK